MSVEHNISEREQTAAATENVHFSLCNLNRQMFKVKQRCSHLPGTDRAVWSILAAVDKDNKLYRQ